MQLSIKTSPGLQFMDKSLLRSKHVLRMMDSLARAESLFFEASKASDQLDRLFSELADELWILMGIYDPPSGEIAQTIRALKASILPGLSLSNLRHHFERFDPKRERKDLSRIKEEGQRICDRAAHYQLKTAKLVADKASPSKSDRNFGKLRIALAKQEKQRLKLDKLSNQLECSKNTVTVPFLAEMVPLLASRAQIMRETLPSPERFLRVLDSLGNQWSNPLKNEVLASFPLPLPELGDANFCSKVEAFSDPMTPDGPLGVGGLNVENSVQTSVAKQLHSCNEVQKEGRSLSPAHTDVHFFEKNSKTLEIISSLSPFGKLYQSAGPIFEDSPF